MKPTIKTKFVLILVLIWSIPLIFALVSAESTSKTIKEGRIVIDEPSINGSFFISANISENEIVSPVLKADFSFNSLYVKWQTPESEAVLDKDFTIYVKFLNENWSDWQKIHIDDDISGKDTSQPVIASQQIGTKLTDSFQYKIVYNSPAAKNILKDLEFVFLDSSKGPKTDFKISTVANDQGLNIISRADWGANENYKYDATGADLWEEEYYTPKKFIIHHTAGQNANQDPKATLRSIQYWHAVSNGWGDIGYNYIIDASGNIYEGRKGGDGVVGGHAYMNNRNSIGIAILGCYQTTENGQPANCNTPDQLTDATQQALDKLIAVKAREFNIDPLGQSEFNGQMLPNVIGHNSVGQTLCPGNILTANLQNTRQLAYNLLQDLGGYKAPLPTAAEYVRQSGDSVTIEQSKTAEVIVEFKNTGQAVWRGYEDAGLYIAESAIKNKLAAIGSVSIAMKTADATDNIVKYKLIDGNVYPGQTGKFKLVLTAPSANQTVTKNFTLAWQNKGYFPNSDFSLSVKGIPCSSCQRATPGTAIYNASLSQTDWPDQMSAEATQNVTIKFQNTGNQTFSQDKLKLKIIYENQYISPFRNSSWYNEYASIPPTEAEIYPNGTANFRFNLRAPSVVASFPHTLTLYYNDQVLYQFDKTINVVSPYAAEITQNTLPVAMLRSWRPTVKLTFKNTGTKTWDNPTLKSYDIDGTNSWFRDSSWQDKKTIKKSWQDVAPGEEITFEFKIQPYWKPNTYPHVYKLFDGDQDIYINGKKEFLTYTRVD